MKTIARKLLLPAAALLLGFVPAATVTAQTTSSDHTSGRAGLLGENYFVASYVWYSYEDLPIDGKGMNLEFNWSIIPHLDFTSTFEWMETDSYLGVQAEMQTLMAGVRGFTTQGSVSFYAEGLAGVAAAKADYLHEDAFAYRIGGGAEIRFGSRFSLTPFAYYQEYITSGYDSGGSFYYGAKVNFWLHERVGLLASYSRNDDGDSSATLGINFRF